MCSLLIMSRQSDAFVYHCFFGIATFCCVFITVDKCAVFLCPSLPHAHRTQYKCLWTLYLTVALARTPLGSVALVLSADRPSMYPP